MTSTDNLESAAIESGTPSSEETDDNRGIQLAVEAALDRKAEQLIVLDINSISSFAEHFLICNGTNERQVQAIADSVLHKLRDAGIKPLHVEGLRHGRWILLDYGGEMVIHIFLDDAREFYGLERLWSDAPNVTSQFVQ